MGLAAMLGFPEVMAAPAAASQAKEAQARKAQATKTQAGEAQARGTVGPNSGQRWPKPLATRKFLRIRLRHAGGKVTQERTEQVTYPRAPKRRRVVGRFLAEVYAGNRLLDVVPFNFPLLAPAESFTSTGQRIAMQMEANLVTVTEIQAPLTPAVDRLLVRDVGTGRQWPLEIEARGRRQDGSKDRPAPAARPAPSSRPTPAARPAPSSRPAPSPGPRPERPRGERAKT